MLDWPISAGPAAALGLLAMPQAWFTAYGLQYASVGQVGPFRYTAVIFAALLDWLVWGAAPTPTGMAGLGIIVIGAVVVLGARRK